MTTIAYDGETIAADTICIDDNYIVQHPVRKILRLPSNCGFDFIALAGQTGMSGDILNWVNTGMLRENRIPDEFDALLVQGADVYEVTSSDYNMFHHESFCAVGSGAKFAMAAMAAGCNAKRAVEIAGQLDPYTNSNVHTLSLKNHEVNFEI